jgi:NAD(P)-dependent dehydrogenase (short-subunit alcohol dehydrogenase family)
MSTDTSLAGRVVVITGATGGIGKETAVGLASRGARVIMVGRDPARTAAAVDEVKQRSESTTVESALADLSSIKAVRGLAAELHARTDRIHILVNNAGAIFMKHHVTDEGLEQTFALNHMSYFLLTELVLDLLERGAPARIVNVASNGHTRGRIHLDDLQIERRRYGGIGAYCDSKLMNVMWTYELARRLDPAKITANSVHPGAVATGWAQNDPSWFKIAVKIAQPFLLTAEEGARTSIHVATDPELAGVTGKYFASSRAKRSVKRSYDESVQKQLWQKSEEIAARI